MRRLLLIAVLAKVAFSLGAGIHALAIRNWVALPGAFLRAVIMGTLGYCALRGQPRWCLWTFVTFEYMTGLGALALGFVWARKHDVLYEPVSLTIFAVFSVLGLAATLGGRVRTTAA